MSQGGGFANWIQNLINASSEVENGTAKREPPITPVRPFSPKKGGITKARSQKVASTSSRLIAKGKATVSMSFHSSARLVTAREGDHVCAPRFPFQLT
jgi:hypothetical protein